MPRNRQHSSHNAEYATIYATERIIAKETTFRNDINYLHDHASVFAETISISGPVESSLREEGNENHGNNDDMEEFMRGQRERLKLLTEQLVNSSRYVKAFVSAAESIKSDILSKGDTGENGNDNDDSAVDYETMLQTKLEIERHELEKNSISVAEEEMSRKIRQNLNEKEPSRSGSNRRNGNNDEDDDEIEIEVTQNNRELELKCPLTGQLFKNPYKNKVCGHRYDLHAIQQHLRIKQACPVMGCKNNRVTMSQLEPDGETKIKVRRFISRMEEEKRRNAMSQDFDIEDDDTYDAVGGGMTFIK